MMNNKGQTLVLFVILIPFILILLGFVIDISSLSLEKVKVDNTIRDVLKDCLENNKNEEEIVNLININNIYIKKINMENSILYMEVSKEYVGNIFKRKYNLNFKYKVYMENDKVIIKKE